MPKIKITSVPPGIAPEPIRAAWLHLEIPFDPDSQKDISRCQIDCDIAVEVLRIAEKADALAYYTKLLGAPFSFPKTCYDIIS